MKKQISVLSVLAICLTIFLVSCMKENKTDNFDTQATVQSDDQSQVSAQIEGTSDDVNVILERSGVAARGQGLDTCGYTVTIDSANGVRTLTITYNGIDCLSRFSRTGVVKVSIPAGVKWKNPGATITVQYINVVFTNKSNNKSITINGSHTITNVSGNLLYQLSQVGPIIHTINSDGMTVTFDNGTQRTWKVARKRVFSYDGGIVITVTGTHTEGNVTNIAEWGTNREGRSFTSAIVEPLVFKQNCAFRLGKGKITHTLPAFTSSATFGLNSAGESTTCPGAGKYYVKIEWAIAGGATHTSLHPY